MQNPLPGKDRGGFLFAQPRCFTGTSPDSDERMNQCKSSVRIKRNPQTEYFREPFPHLHQFFFKIPPAVFYKLLLTNNIILCIIL
ncbi:MAG TPA: hypothetical protein DCM57_01420 [Treponema sp.]|nr:hypothetical protein [Treponema sp.]HBB42324.1 hypothetical protein [Treponema sp.]